MVLSGTRHTVPSKMNCHSSEDNNLIVVSIQPGPPLRNSSGTLPSLFPNTNTCVQQLTDWCQDKFVSRYVSITTRNNDIGMVVFRSWDTLFKMINNVQNTFISCLHHSVNFILKITLKHKSLDKWRWWKFLSRVKTLIALLCHYVLCQMPQKLANYGCKKWVRTTDLLHSRVYLHLVSVYKCTVYCQMYNVHRRKISLFFNLVLTVKVVLIIDF